MLTCDTISRHTCRACADYGNINFSHLHLLFSI